MDFRALENRDLQQEVVDLLLHAIRLFTRPQIENRLKSLSKLSILTELFFYQCGKEELIDTGEAALRETAFGFIEGRLLAFIT